MPNETTVPSERRSFLRTFGEFLRLALIAAAIALPIRYFVAQPFIVRGASMEPNYYDSEYLVIDELSYFFREPERGEVVVFRYPLNPREYFIKRVIGLPEESVIINEGKIFIANNEDPLGFLLEENYLPSSVIITSEMQWKLGEGEYIVFGDNRLMSSDSRSWGVLGRKFITGRAIFRAWPIQRFGVLQNP